MLSMSAVRRLSIDVAVFLRQPQVQRVQVHRAMSRERASIATGVRGCREGERRRRTLDG